MGGFGGSSLVGALVSSLLVDILLLRDRVMLELDLLESLRELLYVLERRFRRDLLRDRWRFRESLRDVRRERLRDLDLVRRCLW